MGFREVREGEFTPALYNTSTSSSQHRRDSGIGRVLALFLPYGL